MSRLVSRRAGFTLVESVVALTLLGIMLSVTLATLNRQVRLFASLSAQTDAVQTGRFAMGMLEKDLPTTGTNVPAGQPFLVYADTHVVAFSADYTSNTPNDPFAIYIDRGAWPQWATAATKARRFRIPGTTVMYPDTTYTLGGQNSPAETIMFYVEPDSSTDRGDDYVLYRKVNNQPLDMLARGLLRASSGPFFEYFSRPTPAGPASALQQVPAAHLPLRHVRAIHGAVDDTGAVARIDSLRAVRVNFRVTDGQPGNRERIYSFSRTVPLLNIGSKSKKTCGDDPILGSVSFVAVASLVDESPIVRLTWLAATDDRAGERDVVRYVIYRALEPGVLGDPYISLPAGETSYIYVDTDVASGQVYYYSLAAQDCASSLSDMASSMIIVP